jgi:uncharacterized protein (DUF2236 family)
MDPVEALRTQIAGSVRRLVAGEADGVVHLDLDRDDPGMFGPTSATWQVHADIAMLIGGVRALLLQSLHPLVMAGVADHSAYRTDPLGRLHRTAAFIGTTTFGTTQQANEAIALVRRIHTKVNGHAPDGRPYRANDPHLLAWVHLTEVDSFLLAVRRYGTGSIDAATADRYVAEMAEVGERLGGRELPRARAELRAGIDAYRPELGGRSTACCSPRRSASCPAGPAASSGSRACRSPKPSPCGARPPSCCAPSGGRCTTTDQPADPLGTDAVLPWESAIFGRLPRNFWSAVAVRGGGQATGIRVTVMVWMESMLWPRRA